MAFSYAKRKVYSSLLCVQLVAVAIVTTDEVVELVISPQPSLVSNIVWRSSPPTTINSVYRVSIAS